MVLENDFISSIIKKHLTIKKIEKDKYGEVFTPETLIDKILFHFPLDVWSKPHLKWLEPTAGIGNFMMIIYLKLMEGLKEWEKNKEIRSNHIIRNMLFMVETNEKNIEICKSIFGENANIVCEDFLKSNVFNIQFDIIIGNPPFQSDVTEKKRSGSKNKLYERILSKCFTILKPEGYISFITPDNLFSGGSKMYLEMIENQVTMVSFEKTIQDFFPKIQQFMCYFIVHKIKQTKKYFTKIISNDGTNFYCLLEDRPVNPVRDWNEATEQLVKTYITNKKNNGVYNRGNPLHTYSLLNTNIEFNESYPVNTSYPLIYQPNKKLSVMDKTYAKGIGEKKVVIFLISPHLECEEDTEGVYGVGPNTFYYPLEKKEDVFILGTFFRSKTYNTLMLSTKTTRQFIKLACLQYLNINNIILQDD